PRPRAATAPNKISQRNIRGLALSTGYQRRCAGDLPQRPQAASAFGCLLSIDFRLSTSAFAPPAPLVSSPVPSSAALLRTIDDSVLNGPVSLPPATSAIGLPSLAAWAAAFGSYGKTMSTFRSIDCSKSLRVISSAPPAGTPLAMTMTLVCG